MEFQQLWVSILCILLTHFQWTIIEGKGMPRRSSQSTTGISQNDAPVAQGVIKASGVCSRCLSVRQLHLRDGTVHQHGPRNSPCPGSKQPPLTQPRQDDRPGGGAAAGPLLTGGAQEGSGTIVPLDPPNPRTQRGGDGLNRHPRHGGIMKHVPKGARFACSQALEGILNSINSNPRNVENWHRLLRFASTVLAQPPRAGRRRNMASVIKKRIENQDLMKDEEPEADVEFGSRKRVNARELFLAAVNAKVEEGNIRAASRILCSQESPVVATFESLAAIQEKHPPNNWVDEMADLPEASPSAPFQVSVREVGAAIRSFPAGSAGGPDGLRPQHLLDLINNRESAGTLLQAMTDFTNVMLRGECPREMREVMFGGTLIALSKKTGGLRPIVIGYVWRRLAAKCANQYALGKLEQFFGPHQVGIGTPGGGEAAVHAARNFITTMQDDQIFIKLDFANAFNSMRRDVMLRSVHETIPELYAFIHQAYSEESTLQFGRYEVRSQMGPQQGDPLGPLLFCMPLQTTLRSLQSQFKLGYLDDLSLGGIANEVRQDLEKIVELESTLGISLNRHKCEIFSETEVTGAEFDNFRRMVRDELTLLGAPLFRGKALDESLQEHSNTLERVLKDLTDIQVQAALLLLRSCFGAAKMTYMLRTSPCWNHPLLDEMDQLTKTGLEKIINNELSDVQWLQASLPIRDGGLGIRRISMLASSAYLASAASTAGLVGAILVADEWSDAYRDEMMEARKDSLPAVMEPIPREQKTWDRPLIDSDKMKICNGCDDPLSQARLRALTAAHAGDWLGTIPLAACGLGLSNEAVRVAVGFRLGLTLCASHRCQCGEIADPGGHHGLVCRRSTGRAARHAALNDIIWRALSKADIPSSKEPSGLSRTDGKRPDGATLVPWTRGRFIAWDATAVHTCASSYLHLTSTVTGGAAEQAAERKSMKYTSLPATHEFIPVAFESLGPINRTGLEFLQELGRRMTEATGDPRESMHLFQRLSVCTQRFNGVAFRGTFGHEVGDENQ